MKTLVYIFITVIISLTLMSAIQNNSGKTKSIILRADDKNVSSDILKKSADIISSRLKLVGLSSYQVNVSKSNGQINIILPEVTDMTEIEGLVTAKGDIAFYETYNKNEIIDLLKTDNKLFTLLSSYPQQTPGTPIVGCTVSADRSDVNKYLVTATPVSKCKFMWGYESKKSEYCLFALKTSQDGRPLLERSDVDSVRIITSDDHQEPKIHIRLRQTAIKTFADATRSNLDKSIAIVIDDRVYSWPVVRSVIEGGEIEVTGSFTAKEADYFPVIFNSDQLPVGFNIVK